MLRYKLAIDDYQLVPALLLYYITDRTQFPGSERERREYLLQRIAEAARCGVDFIQLREKDLPVRDLEGFAKAAMKTIRISSSTTRLLINSRTDIAVATGADGVHLRSKDVSPAEVRRVWRLAHRSDTPTVAESCHTEAEVISARDNGADFVVFGPVFGKKGAPENRLAVLNELCAAGRHGIPVLALGGVTVENSQSCIDSGAAGVAGIRLFQQGDVTDTVRILRALS